MAEAPKPFRHGGKASFVNRFQPYNKDTPSACRGEFSFSGFKKLIPQRAVNVDREQGI